MSARLDLPFPPTSLPLENMRPHSRPTSPSLTISEFSSILATAFDLHPTNDDHNAVPHVQLPLRSPSLPLLSLDHHCDLHSLNFLPLAPPSPSPTKKLFHLPITPTKVFHHFTNLFPSSSSSSHHPTPVTPPVHQRRNAFEASRREISPSPAPKNSARPSLNALNPMGTRSCVDVCSAKPLPPPSPAISSPRRQKGYSLPSSPISANSSQSRPNPRLLAPKHELQQKLGHGVRKPLRRVTVCCFQSFLSTS